MRLSYDLVNYSECYLIFDNYDDLQHVNFIFFTPQKKKFHYFEDDLTRKSTLSESLLNKLIKLKLCLNQRELVRSNFWHVRHVFFRIFLKLQK
jgi:hypothetical protein